ncbi:MAG: histidine--tRNA ligase [Thermacetogeniaceae bacterium]|jgi:histidyl-tRNA synthetase|nr:histidine--tRNA ligase [Syntrophomonadaceae bacterium]
MVTLIKAPRGTKDLLPGEIEKWHYVEKIARELSEIYGYHEIRIPIFEHTELFQRGVGDTTDIVQKEMYTFQDRGGRSITLRPEGTAGVVRAYLENHLNNQPQPVKLYYLGPMFRYDRPQAGRMRQFHQLGIEAFGSNDPALDMEVICYTYDFFTKLGLTNLRVLVNSVGCPQCRSNYGRALKEFTESHRDLLCANCRDRLERNPLRILDCKEESCQQLLDGSPDIHDYLCGDCSSHFQQVQEYLQLTGMPFEINKKLVRGLDYYTQTVFEVTTVGPDEGSLAGGGRYNNLVETIGGLSIPGIGVAIGLERVLIALENQGVQLPIEQKKIIYIATAGEDPEGKLDRDAVLLLLELRKAGFAAEKDLMGRSLKAQMKFAGRLGASYVVIFGLEEIQQGRLLLRDMLKGEQVELPKNGLVEYLKSLLN